MRVGGTVPSLATTSSLVLIVIKKLHQRLPIQSIGNIGISTQLPTRKNREGNMGYVVKKVRDTKNGKTSVRLRADGTPYWQVVYENRSKSRLANIPREQPIHRDQLESRGIDDRLTFEQVREICRSLNSKANLEKKNERVRSQLLARQNQDGLIQSSFLPEYAVKIFEEKILLRRFAGSEEKMKTLKLFSHWKFVQALIAEMQMEPKDYADDSIRIYRYLELQKISPAYTVKVLRMLNAWGQFYTKHRGGTGIEEVRMPRGVSRQGIARAYQRKDEYKGPADILHAMELEANQSKLLDYNYNWLYLSVWLGLRPEEVDNLKNLNSFTVEMDDDQATSVLWVFQSKLTSVAEAKAWKPIPLIVPEQVKCIKIIEDGNFKRPLNKTLRKIFSEKRVTGYSGRKGFTDMMLTLGQGLEEISLWLGHTSIDTTWKSYKNKQQVRFKKVA